MHTPQLSPPESIIHRERQELAHSQKRNILSIQRGETAYATNLRDRVKFPTGGKARMRQAHEPRKRQIRCRDGVNPLSRPEPTVQSGWEKVKNPYRMPAPRSCPGVFWSEGKSGLHGPSIRAGCARSWPHQPQPYGGGGAGEGWRDRRRGISSPSRRATCRDICPAPGGRAGQRGHIVHQPGALLPLWAHSTLH